MSEFLAYTCRVCGKAGLVEYENPTGAEWDWASEALCHDRCAEFMQSKLRESRAVDQILIWLQRKLKDGEEADNADAREKARKALVKATSRFCTAVTRYYRKAPAWEPDLADGILKQPDKWRKILDYFESKQR